MAELTQLPPSNEAPPVSAIRTDWPLNVRLRAHLSIARLDHSIKNLFVLPGIIVPLTVRPSLLTHAVVIKIILGLIATTLVACSNYVINELLDAPFDRLHPKKATRPAALGQVTAPMAYLQWLAMMAFGLCIAFQVSTPFAITAAVLWIMGCIYNIRPLRTKDVIYLDVLTESINNPLRLLLGWFIVAPTMNPPASLLLFYWFLGCYFMGLKRFSELRFIKSEIARSYRKSFQSYTERKLLVSVMFYASASMLFFGAFCMRYRMELILAFPFISLLMAIYMNLSYEEDSAAQAPEKLYRHRGLMLSLVITVAVMATLLIVPLPALTSFFTPTFK